MLTINDWRGPLEALGKKERRMEAATGLAKTEARWSYYNSLTSMASDVDWGAYNRHLWRFAAMYKGGDLDMAQFPGSFAHQRLWEYRQPAPSEAQEFERSEDDAYCAHASHSRFVDALLAGKPVDKSRGLRHGKGKGFARLAKLKGNQ